MKRNTPKIIIRILLKEGWQEKNNSHRNPKEYLKAIRIKILKEETYCE